jgi:hypothetical protein
VGAGNSRHAVDIDRVGGGKLTTNSAKKLSWRLFEVAQGSDRSAPESAKALSPRDSDAFHLSFEAKP